ncbi:MAG: LD-carboxypeptidase [candidate division SR1 bacterium]|nr:LD-carboxypeptidase [candidate division SR1 bacterium]
MKIAITNLCSIGDFAKHRNYQDSMNFLKEENIEYIDFCSGEATIEGMVKKFNQSLDSDADLIWVISGGLSCIKTLDKIDREKVVSSNKKFYGLSDFTHFSTRAVSLGLTCYYGQGLAKIKQYFPTIDDRKFIVNFLKTGNPNSSKAKSFSTSIEDLNIDKTRIVGGHMLLFTFIQSQVNIDLKDRHLFLEYHSSAIGEDLEELEYYLDQVLYIIKNNLPKGFILGRSELKNLDETEINIDEINNFLVSKLSTYNLPIYYIDHFNNVITFC